jgi:hypothetical protein
MHVWQLEFNHKRGLFLRFAADMIIWGRFVQPVTKLDGM